MSELLIKNKSTGEWETIPYIVGPQGPKGEDGKDGVDGKDGANGKDGVSIATVTINEDGKLVINYSDGTSDTLGKVVGEKGKDGTNGLNGQDGQDGYTPVKGVDYFDGTNGKTPVKGTDYFTTADKAEIVNAVIAALPVYGGEVV